MSGEGVEFLRTLVAAFVTCWTAIAGVRIVATFMRGASYSGGGED